MNASPLSTVPGGRARLAGHEVARVGYGAMQLERLHAEPDVAVSLIRRAVEGGVNHVDTAHFYGNGLVNDALRRALPKGDGTVIATKIGADPTPGGPTPLRAAQRPEELRASVQDNLRSLGRDRLDVVYLRRLDVTPGILAEGDQVVPLDDQLEVLTALRDEGTIGAIGLSGVTRDRLHSALPAGIACVQNGYTVIRRDEEDLLSLCRQERIAWVPFFPLGSAFPTMPHIADDPIVQDAAAGLGITAAQVGLAWLLAHAPNIFLVPGTANAAHLDENLAAGTIELPPETIATLDSITAAVGATA